MTVQGPDTRKNLMRPASDSPAAPGLVVVNATQAVRDSVTFSQHRPRGQPPSPGVSELDVAPRPAPPARYVAPHEDPAWPPLSPCAATDVTRGGDRVSGEQPDVRALLRRLADLPEQELRTLLQLVEQAAPPDSDENLLEGTISVDVRLSGVLIHTPPGGEVAQTAASFWEEIRPRTPEQGVAWLVEFRKVLQAVLLFVSAMTAGANALEHLAAEPPAAPESGQSSVEHSRDNPSR